MVILVYTLAYIQAFQTDIQSTLNTVVMVARYAI